MESSTNTQQLNHLVDRLSEHIKCQVLRDAVAQVGRSPMGSPAYIQGLVWEIAKEHKVSFSTSYLSVTQSFTASVSPAKPFRDRTVFVESHQYSEGHAALEALVLYFEKKAADKLPPPEPILPEKLESSVVWLNLEDHELERSGVFLCLCAEEHYEEWHYSQNFLVRSQTGFWTDLKGKIQPAPKYYAHVDLPDVDPLYE